MFLTKILKIRRNKTLLAKNSKFGFLDSQLLGSGKNVEKQLDEIFNRGTI